MSVEALFRSAGNTGSGNPFAVQSHPLRRHDDEFAANDTGADPPTQEFDLSAGAECRFEIYREEERHRTSTLLSGGDWRWRLITSDGLILAEAAGYASESTCQAAVATLRKRAASAPVFTRQGDRA